MISENARIVISRVYLSFSVLVLAFLAIISFYSVKQEFETSAIFSRAHENLERNFGYNPQNGKLTLEEARELVALESKIRLFEDKPFGVETTLKESKKDFNPDHYLIDRACFSSNGYIIDDFAKPDRSDCVGISYFKVGRPCLEVLQYVGLMIGATILLFFLKKWLVWVTNIKEGVNG